MPQNSAHASSVFMANKTKLTRVVIYLTAKRAKVAEKQRKLSEHKNINRLVSRRVDDWLDAS